MADPTSTVIAVMDTVDHLQVNSRFPVQDPVDVSARVRKVYQDQDVPLSETLLAQALARHAPQVPVVPALSENALSLSAPAPKSEQVPPEGVRSDRVFEVILALGLVMQCSIMVSVILSRVHDQASDKVTAALVSAAHQDSLGANQTLKSQAVTQSFEKMGAHWTVADQDGHTTIALTHAPALVAQRLALQMETPAPHQSALDLSVNGVKIKNSNDLSKLLPACATALKCDLPDLSITLADTATH